MRLVNYTLKTNDETELPVLERVNATNYSAVSSLNTPDLIAKVFMDVYEMGSLAEESVYGLFLNTALKPIGISKISQGSVNSSIVSTRSLFIRALLCGAVCLVLVHNHPSGECSPSTEDGLVTRKIRDASRLLDLKLVDHIIVGRGSYYSFKEHGRQELI